MSSDQQLQQWLKAEEKARHGVVIYLTLGGLIFLDISSIQDEKRREEVTRTWVVWGITFLLLAFFIIAPEQDALESSKKR
ncbi:MAG: hypothetical protein ACXVP5_01625 [Tumebacillaceae bacterium]